jgi:hypothetical protein
MSIPYRTLLVFHVYCVTLQSSNLPPSGRSATCCLQPVCFRRWSKSAGFPIVRPYHSASESQLRVWIKLIWPLFFPLCLPSRKGIQNWTGVADLHTYYLAFVLFDLYCGIDRQMSETDTSGFRSRRISPQSLYDSWLLSLVSRIYGCTDYRVVILHPLRPAYDHTSTHHTVQALHSLTT